MQDELLQRADRAIAESRRLVGELCDAIGKARQLDRWLQYLHQRRIEEERFKKPQSAQDILRVERSKDFDHGPARRTTSSRRS